MAADKTPLIYGNVVQVTRTPWEVNLHVLHAVVPRTLKAGEAVDLLEKAEEVAIVTLPLEVGRKLIDVLRRMTNEGVLEVLEIKEEEKEAGNV